MCERASRRSESPKKSLWLLRAPPKLTNQSAADKNRSESQSHDPAGNRLFELSELDVLQQRACNHSAEQSGRKHRQLQIMDITAAPHHRRKHRGEQHGAGEKPAASMPSRK